MASCLWDCACTAPRVTDHPHPCNARNVRPIPASAGGWWMSTAAQRRFALGQTAVGRVSTARPEDLPFGGATTGTRCWELVRLRPPRAQARRPEPAARLRPERRLGSSGPGPTADLGRPQDLRRSVRSRSRVRPRSVPSTANGTPRPSPTGGPRSPPTRRPKRPIATRLADLGRPGKRRSWAFVRAHRAVA
jgi:hypothetical protein